jgi:hypothetical protein
LASWIWFGAPAAALAVALALYGLHRLCLHLESQGKLYYRNRSGGGAGNVLQPLDRLTRPSIEHVEQTEDRAKLVRKTDCGEDDAHAAPDPMFP